MLAVLRFVVTVKTAWTRVQFRADECGVRALVRLPAPFERPM